MTDRENEERSAGPCKGMSKRLIGIEEIDGLFPHVRASPPTLSRYKIRPDVNEISQFSCCGIA